MLTGVSAYRRYATRYFNMSHVIINAPHDFSKIFAHSMDEGGGSWAPYDSPLNPPLYIYIYIYIYVCVCMSQKITHLEKCSLSFLFALRHRDCDAQLPVHPRSSALLLFLCSHLCAPSGSRGLREVLLCLPQCWLDERVTTTVCCWLLQCSKYFIDSALRAQGMCSVKL